jgi:hypothetical protein
MAEVLRLREAEWLIGVSPGRLYCGITHGRLVAEPGGGRGEPRLVNLTLQVLLWSEGPSVPDGGEMPARSERVECSGCYERAERSISIGIAVLLTAARRILSLNEISMMIIHLPSAISRRYSHARRPF